MDLSFRDISVGSRFNIVAEVEKEHFGILCCRGVSPIQLFEIHDAPQLHCGTFTFYDLERSMEDLHVCRFGKDTEAILHPPKGEFQTIKIFDVCSGIGGFTLGSQILGMPTLAFVEINPLACDVLRTNFSSPVIEGDLASLDVVKKNAPFERRRPATGHRWIAMPGLIMPGRHATAR